jgi:hypothetical protein
MTFQVPAETVICLNRKLESTRVDREFANMDDVITRPSLARKNLLQGTPSLINRNHAGSVQFPVGNGSRGIKPFGTADGIEGDSQGQESGADALIFFAKRSQVLWVSSK